MRPCVSPVEAVRLLRGRLHAAARSMRRALAITTLLSVAGCASWWSNPVPVRSESGALVDARGMTLYTYDRDAPGRSRCVAACARIWPPLPADAEAQPRGSYSIVTRDDGSRQWAYKNRPLYRRAADAGPGDRGGDGIDNMWRTAKP